MARVLQLVLLGLAVGACRGQEVESECVPREAPVTPPSVEVTQTTLATTTSVPAAITEATQTVLTPGAATEGQDQDVGDVAEILSKILTKMKANGPMQEEEEELSQIDSKEIKLKPKLRQETFSDNKDMQKVLEKWRARVRSKTGVVGDRPKNHQRKHRQKKEREQTRQLRVKQLQSTRLDDPDASAPRKAGKTLRVMKTDLLKAAQDNEKLKQKLLGKGKSHRTDNE